MKLVIELPGTTPIVSLIRALMHCGVKISYIREYSSEMRIRTEPLNADERANRERIGGSFPYSVEPEDSPRVK